MTSSGRRILKISVYALMFVVLMLAVTLWWLLFTGSGARFGLSQASSRYQQQCECVLEYTYLSGNLWQGFGVEQLHYEHQETELTLERLLFKWSPWQLADRQLRIAELQVDGLNLRLPENIDVPQNEPLNDPLREEQLKGWIFALPVAIHLEQFYGSRLAIQNGGSSFNLSALESAIALNSQSLVIDLYTLQMADTELSGNASLNDQLQLNSQVSWSFQAGELFSGELQVEGSLGQLALNHTLQAPLAITTQGTLQTGLFTDNDFTFTLQHQASVVALDDFGLAAASITELSLTTTGDLRDIALSGNALLNQSSIQPVRLDFNADYQVLESALSVDFLTLLSDQVDASVSGEYLLAENSVQIDWALRDFSNSELLSGFDFKNVSGAGHLSLSLEPVLIADIIVQDIRGQLNDYPLSAEGSLLLGNSGLESVNLQINSGDNLLRISGTASPELDVEWQLQAPAVEQSWTSLQGSLSGSGQVQGSNEQPILTGSVAGSELLLMSGEQRFSLSDFQLMANGSPNAIEGLSVQLGLLRHTSGEGVESPLLQSADINASGSSAEHRLSATLLSSHPQYSGNLRLNLNGVWQNEQWQVVLEEVGLQSSALGNWQLQAPLQLQYGQDQWQVFRHCWASDELQFCTQADSLSDEGINAELQLSGLPLEWFDKGNVQQPNEMLRLQRVYGAILPDNINVTGKASLDASIQGYRNGGWKSLSASVAPESFVLQITQELDNDEMTLIPEQNRFALNDVVLSLDNRNQQWQAVTDFRITQLYEDEDAAPAIQGAFSGLVALDEKDNIQGEVSFEFEDLAWLETLVPAMKNPAGSLVGVASIGGTRSKPEVTAELELQQGHFQVPAYGLDVQDVQLQLSSSQSDAHLSLSAVSGGGQISVDARMADPLEQNRSLELELNGDNFLLVSHENLHFNVSPELQVSLDQGVVSVTGQVLVPELDLKLDAYLEDAVGGAVNVSRDVVVVNSDEDALVYTSSQNLGFNTNLTLSLGEQVHVSGFGLDAELGGELRLEQEANRALFAYGELGVKTGTYKFYGQTLTTDGGRLLFYGNVLNPVLDMKAYRQTTSAEVGVQLRGNINAIEGGLYSTPRLPDNEILALLATGKSFGNLDNSDNDALLSAVANFGLQRSGKLTGALGEKLGLDSLAISTGDNYQESALGVGKYLSPDLMMRYEIGLFDRKAVLSLDYRLTERLKLEVKTGLSQSVDFTYTVEKD